MSDVVFKVSLRMHIPELDGASYAQALDFYRPLLGEPVEVDVGDDGVVTYFGYEGIRSPIPRTPGSIKDYLFPVHTFRNKEGCSSPRWGVELVLRCGSVGWDWRGGFCSGSFTLSLDIDSVRKALRDSNVLPGDLVDRGKLYAYTWYNGGDEPIEFD